MKAEDIKDLEEVVEEEIEEMEDNMSSETEKTKDNKKEKKKSKKEKKDSKDEKIEELTDQVMRSMAEFENFRKRSEKEKAQMFTIGAKSIIETVLPVIDNFERGLEPLTDEEKQEPFAHGMVQIYKQLQDALKTMGVVAIEAVGKEFNPDFHEAVLHEENDEYDDNIVLEEFQKGYMYNDIVVRYSMVKVVN